MKDKLISVIIPIYNVQDLLPKCIESIINQTYEKLEIILVNDGSKDNSALICEQYAKKDKRIKVIHKPNGGLSDARNAGLEIAKGDYIAFVDSDDYIINNAYEVMILEATRHDLDIVAANAEVLNGKSKSNLMKEKHMPTEIITGLDYLCESIKQSSFQACAWLNLYRKNLLIDNNFYFEKGLLHEDEEWTPRVFLKANKVKYMDFKFYNYVIREGSIMTKKDKTKNGLDIIKTCYKLNDIYISYVDKDRRKILNSYLLNIYLGGIYIGRLDRPPYRKSLKKSFIFDKINNPRDLFKASLFLINIRLYCKINSLSKTEF
ncbi:glycosyltransferase [Peribacillus frigoritolerans]|uniref:glycosyltransferase n=1 Tax=Peribacillus frigoritolerans TaxID=450367 RepID=UPI003514E5F8